MKKRIIILCLLSCLLLEAVPVLAGEAALLVEDIPTVQAYTDEAVDPEDLTKILLAGINAPSGMNLQPWHFSVVTNPEVVKEMASGGDMSSAARAGITAAPVVIVISCREGAAFDAGLATQTMSIEGQLLGYGTKIFSYPTYTLNGERKAEFKEMLDIPDDMSAVALLIVGVENKYPDVVSQPTSRYPLEEMVSYIP